LEASCQIRNYAEINIFRKLLSTIDEKEEEKEKNLVNLWTSC
jgi:hypothetical protein